MKKRIVSTTLLCAILAACGGSSGSGGATSALAPVATQAPPPAPAVEINYRADLVPLLAGSYSGDCSQPPAVAPVTATVLVTAEGAVTSTGVSGNLLGTDVGMNFSKQFDSSAGPAFSFGATIGVDTFGLFIQNQNGDPLRGEIKTYSGASVVACKNAAATAKLTAKSLFSPIEKYFSAPARDLNCIVAGSNVQTLRYQVQNGELKLGGETFSLTAGLKSESVLVGPLAAIGALNYLIETPDGRSLMLVLDRFGALSQVSAKSGTGATYSCTPL